MTSAIGWELYRTFLGVLEEGSLSGAARQLGITQPTAGRHIAALEQALGVPLFTRSRLGLAPTEAALAIKGYAEAMRSTAAALERAATAQGAGVRGAVRVTASEIIGVEVLPPILCRLCERYPALKVELVLSNRVQDLLRRESDIAVRMTRPQQDLLVARHVGDLELGLYAHEEYLARRGTPRTLADLGRHSIIGYDQETPFLRALAQTLPGLHRGVFSLLTDSDPAQWALLCAGAGVGMCQVALARRRPALRRLFQKQIAPHLETWVTMHQDLRGSARFQVTFDALVAGMQAHARAEEPEPAPTRRRRTPASARPLPGPPRS